MGTEQLKKLIPDWLTDEEVSNLYGILKEFSIDFENKASFAVAVRNSKHWKRGAKHRIGKNTERVFDCRPPEFDAAELGLKLFVLTDPEDNILNHQFTTSFEGELDPEETKVYLDAGATVYRSDYYFKAEPMPDSNLGQTMVAVCPRKYFDTEKCLFDQHLTQDCGGPLDLGTKMEELQEAIFSFDGTVAEAEAYLQKMGLTLNPKLTY